MKQAYTEPDILIIYPDQNQDVLTLSAINSAYGDSGNSGYGGSASWNTEILF